MIKHILLIFLSLSVYCIDNRTCQVTLTFEVIRPDTDKEVVTYEENGVLIERELIK